MSARNRNGNKETEKQFHKVSDIDSIDHFENKIFLTFDIDWASDDVLNYTIDLIEDFDLCATFFVTHDTPVLQRIKNNAKIELGIHPNFNFLLMGDSRYGSNYHEVIDYYLKIVPDAISVRSHSLVQGSQILDAFCDHGLQYDLNLYIPSSSSIELKPIRHFNEKLLRLPHYWEDDLHIISKDSWDSEIYLTKPGLKIFDFHPIHVFLNTEKMERYQEAKPYYGDFKKLATFANNSAFGVRDFLNSLISNVNL